MRIGETRHARCSPSPIFATAITTVDFIGTRNGRRIFPVPTLGLRISRSPSDDDLMDLSFIPLVSLVVHSDKVFDVKCSTIFDNESSNSGHAITPYGLVMGPKAWIMTRGLWTDEARGYVGPSWAEAPGKVDHLTEKFCWSVLLRSSSTVSGGGSWKCLARAC